MPLAIDGHEAQGRVIGLPDNGRPPAVDRSTSPPAACPPPVTRTAPSSRRHAADTFGTKPGDRDPRLRRPYLAHPHRARRRRIARVPVARPRSAVRPVRPAFLRRPVRAGVHRPCALRGERPERGARRVQLAQRLRHRRPDHQAMARRRRGTRRAALGPALQRHTRRGSEGVPGDRGRLPAAVPVRRGRRRVRPDHPPGPRRTPRHRHPARRRGPAGRGRAALSEPRGRLGNGRRDRRCGPRGGGHRRGDPCLHRGARHPGHRRGAARADDPDRPGVRHRRGSGRRRGAPAVAAARTAPAEAMRGDTSRPRRPGRIATALAARRPACRSAGGWRCATSAAAGVVPPPR